MSCSYKLLDTAKEELESIVEYLLSVSDGTSAATSFIGEFEKQISLVCTNPELYGFSRMPELAALGYHAMMVKNYVALYFYRDDTVFVAHVFHQCQDYAVLI